MRIPNWTIFDSWMRPTVNEAAARRSWIAFDDLIAHLRRRAAEIEADLSRSLEPWDQRLKSLGGDPSRTDWSRFRPLRPQREEDWSNWLAWLLEQSDSGAFAQHLLGGGAVSVTSDYRNPDVEREVVVPSADRRADVLVSWRDGSHTHIEVKIGDQDFDKTFDTAIALQKERGRNATWTDFILLPDDDQETWASVRRAAYQKTSNGSTPLVGHVTWTAVACALRRALYDAKDSDAWRAWAYAFCGCVEQKLLEHICLKTPSGQNSSVAHIGKLRSQAVHLGRISIP